MQSTIHEHVKLYDNWVIKAKMHMSGKGKMVTFNHKMREYYPGTSHNSKSNTLFTAYFFIPQSFTSLEKVQKRR